MSTAIETTAKHTTYLFGDLTGKQAAFIDHYLKTRNGTESARVAGYSGDDTALAVEASRTLRIAKVQAELRRRLQRHILSADQVLEGLSDHARADMAQVLTPEGTFDLKYARRKGQSKLLKKLKIKKRIERDKDGNETEYLDHEIELHDAQSALKTLAQYHGLLVERTQSVNVNIDTEVEPDMVLGLLLNAITPAT